MADSRVVVITGGAGYVGSFLAKHLVIRGDRVIIIDKNRKSGDRLVNELNNLSSNNHFFIEADLSDSSCFIKISDLLKSKLVKLDYLINNAAFYESLPGWGVPFLEESYEAWTQVMKVNLFGPFFLTQQLYSLLMESDDASIVNIGSIYGVSGPVHSLYSGLNMTNPAAYSASKAGLVGLSKWLSTTLAPKIRVNIISAGGIEREQSSIFIERYNSRVPLGRMGTEKDLAGIVSLLLSPEASYITGQNIIVDGGWTAW